jgi:hypothetical protein
MRKNVLGQYPSELENQERGDELELLPIPESAISRKEFTPTPKSRPPAGKILPIPKRAGESLIKKELVIPRRAEPKEDDVLTNLRQIARELPRDKNVKRVFMQSLNIILQKNADRDRRGNYILSGNERRYGLKQFILDSLINDELELVNSILKFFGLKYEDIVTFLFDFPRYAMNESLIFNFFINAPQDIDWFGLLEVPMDELYSNWVIKDKLQMMTILLSSAVAVGNDFLAETLVEIWNSWKEGIQEEIDEMEEDEDVETKDELINMVEVIDIRSIR